MFCHIINFKIYEYFNLITVFCINYDAISLGKNITRTSEKVMHWSVNFISSIRRISPIDLIGTGVYLTFCSTSNLIKWTNLHQFIPHGAHISCNVFRIHICIDYFLPIFPNQLYCFRWLMAVLVGCHTLGFRLKSVYNHIQMSYSNCASSYRIVLF